MTDTLQAAINSKAKTLIIPYMGQAWIVRPLILRNDLEIVFEPGVLVLAKRGEFKGKGDSLFTASEVTELDVTRLRRHAAHAQEGTTKTRLTKKQNGAMHW